jgi:hypothetical protein
MGISGVLYRPKSVGLTMNLFSLAILLGLIMTGLDFPHYHSVMPEWLPIGTRAIVCGVILLGMLLVSRRMGWARYLLVLLYAAALFWGGKIALGMMNREMVLAGLAFAQLALLGIGLAVLFQTRANTWFKG